MPVPQPAPVLRWALLAALALGLPACGGGEGGGGRTTLVLAHWMGNDRQLWEERVIRPFEAAHPDIDVVLQTAPYSLHATKALTSIASGSRVGDVVMAEEWFAQEL